MLAKPSLDYIADDAEMWENAPMQKLVEEKKLSAHRHDGFWHCIDTLRDYRRASQLWNEGKAPWKTWP
jgi:glucose-1-phosphate cytidylyltransferase